MNEKQIDKLLEALEGIGRQLNTLALAAAVQERYPNDVERSSMRQEYMALLDAHRSRQQESTALLDSGASDEEKLAAANAMRSSYADIRSFEERHRLFVRFLNRSAKLSEI
ncbi:hypothetical protein [Xanthomonas graminis]|uniref:hypothetical protein n=1 Tax=Xanthomonas graminis TaxID=3390026 RepID=UPI001112D926|nr:hypothetical protein [Xanthomonas translucens]